MKVSIIVPVYNVEKYLPQCLTSLVNQTIDDYEIIVVNDGSPDHSQAIIDDFCLRYPKRFVALEKENGGQGSARNAALKIAKGDFVGFVDSDDWVDDSMYKTMYEAAIEQQADIVICDMVDHFDDGNTIYHHASTFTDPFKVTPSACNKLFKRSLLGNISFPERLWYEDFNFTVKQLAHAEKLACVHEGFYHCHCRTGSTMFNNNAPKNLDMITVLADLKEYMNGLPHAAKFTAVFEYMLLEHLLLTSINRVALQKHPKSHEVIQQMRDYVKKNIPNLSASSVYLETPKKRKLIMFLNYHGMHAVSKLILQLKKAL